MLPLTCVHTAAFYIYNSCFITAECTICATRAISALSELKVINLSSPFPCPELAVSLCQVLWAM